MAGWLLLLVLMYLVLAVFLWDKRKIYWESIKPGGNPNALIFTREEECFFIVLWVVEFAVGVYVLTLIQRADGSRLTAANIFLDCILMLVIPQGKVSILDIYLMLNINKARRKAAKAVQTELKKEEEPAGENPGR